MEEQQIHPTSSHILVARSAAQSLLDSILKRSSVVDYIKDNPHRTIASYSITLSD